MKTILVPTDFSDMASNAIDYAVEIAKLCNAKLFLLHVYDIAIVSPEASIMIMADELERNAMNGLKKIKNEIHHKKGNDLNIECACRCGSSVEEINLFAQEKQSDLIVMGMEGAGYLTEKLIGSTTTSVMSKAKCPVLAIDKNVQYKSIKRIALASDYTGINKQFPLAGIKEFTNLFKAKLYIINVVNEPEPVAELNKEIGAMRLEELLSDYEHSSYHIKNEDVIEGINSFIDEKFIDMLVMIPHEHSVLQRIFSEPNTKRMAFHTKVPLLTFHDRQ